MLKKFFFVGLALIAAQVFGATYYVAVDGNDNDKGSKEKPFASLNKANAVVNAGDTVWVRGGVYDLNDTVYYKRYEMTAGILLTANGESDDKRIYYFAYPGERPIFDGTNLPIGQACRNKGTIDSVMTTSPIVVAAKYLHLKGFEVRNTPMKCNSNSGIFLYASKHIILEQIDSHHNAGPGIFIHDGASGGGGHLVLNCDAHDNYDPTGWQGDGENADGFGVHYQHDGDTTRFVGCRSWWNSDDGYDVLAQEFPVIVENSYAMGNGYIKYGTATPPGVNGHGFKMGYSRTGAGHHIIRNCVAWNNVANGFYSNYTNAGSTWINNTAYKNGDRSFGMASTTYDADLNRTADVMPLFGDNAHVLKNNIAIPNKNSQIGSCWMKDATHNVYVDCPTGENNTWNFNLDLTEDDFVSLDDPSLTVTGEDLSKIPGILGPRNPDGSVPDLDFLKLKEGSRAIDKGEKIGQFFVGEAPDLGAYEFGMIKSSSSDGTNSIKTGNAALTVASGEAAVFDLQGRYLGTLQLNRQQAESIQSALLAKFKTPGIYLVRQGNRLQKVQVK